MRAGQLVLRCFAEKDRDGSWFAMCIDLNLYARAGSEDEVRKQLTQIIVEYVHEAVTDDKEHVHELMLRRAPLNFVLRYYFIKLWCFFFGRDKHDGGSDHRHIPYDDVLPLVPA